MSPLKRYFKRLYIYSRAAIRPDTQCVDVTFVEDSDPPSLESIGCANSTAIRFSAVSTSGGRRWGWYSSGQMIGLGLGVGLPLLIAVAVLGYFLARARRQLKAREKLVG